MTWGDFGVFAGSVVRRVFRRSWSLREVVIQMQRVGVESLTVVNLCAFFIGMVLVLQSDFLLGRFGARAQVSMVVSSAFVREIGPVFAAIMFAGRVGTGVAAELGSMVVTEQIDAYRAFGSDPVAKLAVPRVIATALMLPALTVIADVIGIFSGFLMGVFQLGVPGNVYIQKSLYALTRLDVAASITKGVVFGITVGLIATYVGLRTRRATEAVGESTTRTMVLSVLAILLGDLVLTKFFITLGG